MSSETVLARLFLPNSSSGWTRPELRSVAPSYVTTTTCFIYHIVGGFGAGNTAGSARDAWLLHADDEPSRGVAKTSSIDLFPLLISLLAVWERTGFSIAFTDIATDMNLSETEKGTVFAAYYYGFSITQVRLSVFFQAGTHPG